MSTRNSCKLQWEDWQVASDVIKLLEDSQEFRIGVL